MDDLKPPQFNLSAVNFNPFSNFNFTITPELTSALSGTNIDFTKSSTEVLSAVSNYFAESIRTTTQNLSTPVIHPWDALKMSLFEPDHKFPTINDISVPEEITLECCKDKLDEHLRLYKSRMVDFLANEDKYTVLGPFEKVSVLSECSGTNCFAVTKDRYKNYIEAVETFRSIDPESITEENCDEYILKMNYCLIKMLSRKTID